MQDFEFLANFVCMKTSLSFLPAEKQRDLARLTELIRAEIKDVVMVVLYGSYARGTYVDCDQRTEFGVTNFFLSDYDMLIVTKRRLGVKEFDVYTRIKDKFFGPMDRSLHTNPQFINESISHLNHNLELGQYFYSEITQQGVMLYDSGEYTLSECRELNYAEIAKIAQKYYNKKFTDANDFLLGAKFYADSEKFNPCSFLLHQATENYLRTIPLVYILYGYKDHDLELLMSYCKRYTLELAKVFPRNTDEEERLFKLLQRAYVEARYNDEFVVTRTDIDALIPKIELLRDITEKVCKEQIAYYVQMTKKEKRCHE